MNSEEYLLFIGDYYYPNRWNDFRGIYQTIDAAFEAKEEFKKSLSQDVWGYMWFEIVDTKTWTVYASGDIKD